MGRTNTNAKALRSFTVRARLALVLRLTDGENIEEVAEDAKLPVKVLQSWLKIYQKEGVRGLQRSRWD